MTIAGLQIDEFLNTLRTRAARYGVGLTSENLKQLSNYYALLLLWNSRLHLVAPCSASEFATRHVLESLMIISHLSPNARIADVGSGAGLPIIPALIARPDIHAVLIEASQKKTVFLREAFRVTDSTARAGVIAERFENIPSPKLDQVAVNYVSCRAIDRFAEVFPKLIEWSPTSCTLLLFGGMELQQQIERAQLEFSPVKIPDSERSFLFVIRRP